MLARSLALVGSCWAPPLAAQAPSLTAHGATAEATSATYRATFAAGGFTFSPLPGPIGAGTPSLTFQLVAVERRHGASVRMAPVAPTIVGEQVHYARPDLLERYAVRDDGVEQSFVLDRLPVGNGDLVIRGRLHSDLAASCTDALVETLTFERAGSVGVHVGAVTAIDADGRRARGALRARAGKLELIVPAAFADVAALPLVVDPLIGSTLGVSSPSAEAETPDAAYDSTNQVYAVVWRQRASATLWQPFCAIVRNDGTFALAPQPLTGGHPGGSRVRVANVDGRDSFVIVWDALAGAVPTLYCRTLHAATHIISQTLTIASGATLAFPDVGGESETIPDAAIAVFCNPALNRIYATQVRVPASGQPGLGPTIIVGNALNPITGAAIPQAGGALGRYLVTWSEESIATSSVHGAVIDRDLFLRAPRFDVVPSTAMRPRNPFVDGDGERWVVAYQTANPILQQNAVSCRAVALYPGESTPSLEPAQSIRQSTAALWSASVAMLDDSFLVGYVSEGQAGPTTIYTCGLVSIDPHTCTACEGVFVVESFSLDRADLLAVGQRHPSNSRAAADALAVWSSSQAGVFRTVKARRFHPEDGAATSVGGGCGNGGRAASTCFVLGNGNYQHRLIGATRRAPAILVLGATRLDFPCGACTLVPDPTSGLAITAGLTDGRGAAAVPMPVPQQASLLGASLWQQWLTLPPVGACPLFGLDLSSALRITIQ